ncbi:MAG: PAS domain-containing protein [Candidatus Zixiibacteriota bacterium]|nr:MAG: PAS domain-containing protein [candidate division Zixibacteria bacterium]
MESPSWTPQAPFAVTVCDERGVILDLNDRAAQVFAADGGRELIGKNVLDCHPEPARTRLRQMLQDGSVNCYTIEKHGAKKLIYQAPWYRDGRFAGIVELSLDLPADMPHFIRR